MRTAAAAILLVLVMGGVWLTAAMVRGEEPPAPAVPAGPGSDGRPKAVLAKPVNADPPKAAPAAPVNEGQPKAAPAAPAPAAPAKGEPAVTPPPPIPDVEIPPVPEVGDNPFKPGPPPVRIKPPDIIEEGKRLFNREGRLEVDQIGRAIFVFDSGDKPMWLLESAQREYLETVTDYGKKKARWRISGIVTVYGKRNYLLLTKVVRMMPEEENL